MQFVTIYEVCIDNSKIEQIKSALAEMFTPAAQLKPCTLTNAPDASWDSMYKDFFQITILCNNDKERWDNAYKIAGIDGITEVGGPVVEFSSLGGLQNGPVPSDPRWNHSLTRFDEAVAYTKAQHKLTDQTNIGVAQLDTGFSNHPEIINNIKSRDGKCFIVGEDFNDATDRMDGSAFKGHGTATASVFVGGQTTFSEDRNDGVFPFVDFIPCRIHNSVIFFGGVAIPKAIRYAVDILNCKVITMSMGGIPLFDAKYWKDAVDYVYSKGVIFVSAAGNECGFVVWPAKFSNVIAVAGINFQGRPWPGSCHGPEVDISAPAENVYIADFVRSDTCYNAKGCGTSFATPHVAAAAVLWLNHFKDELQANEFTQKKSLIVDAFSWALKSSANTSSNLGRDYGAGILDARAILNFSPTTYLDSSRDLRDTLTLRSVHSETTTRNEENNKSASKGVDRLVKLEMLFHSNNPVSAFINTADKMKEYVKKNGSDHAAAFIDSPQFESMVMDHRVRSVSSISSFSIPAVTSQRLTETYTKALLESL